MLMLLKTPITCFLFTLYMVGFYYRKPHIPLKSTRIFQRLIAVALLNVSFDLITICTVNQRETVPELINLIVHIIYLMSILGYIYLLFLYLRSYLETDVKFSGGIRTLHGIPFAASTIGIILLPISYVHGKTTDYSLGPKAYALYGSLVVYLVLILYYCLRYWKLLDDGKRRAIVIAVPLYTVTAVIQMMFPETLIVAVCSTLILLGLIFSNENTEKYVDENTSLFNQYSLEKVLEEYDFDRQKPVIGILCICKTENCLEWKQDVLILSDIYRKLRQNHMYGYRVCENGVVFISNAKEETFTILEKIKNYVQSRYGGKNVTIETKVLSGDAAGAKYNCMRNMIAFCTETSSRLAYIDYLTNIYNRNALERDLNKTRNHENIYYFIADLNDLKKVNDTIGHSAGDKLLQGFAGMLADTVGEDGRAYRQGGDEFAVLYAKDAQYFLRSLEMRCREYNQSCAVPISYAIGFCLLKEGNFLDTADQMMYEDKRRKKQKQE